MGALNLGYPLWVLLSVLVVLALLSYYVLRGRVSDRLLVPLSVVLAPVCTVAVVALAVLASALLSPLYEPPIDSVRPQPKTSSALEYTVLETTSPPASPSASATASAPATATATATATASPSP